MYFNLTSANEVIVNVVSMKLPLISGEIPITGQLISSEPGGGGGISDKIL